MLLRRSGPLAVAALLAAAGCSKEVSQTPPASTIVVALFSSPNVPTPNDLALQATPTLPASAQRNLLQSFVDKGGFPNDQAPTLSVPLKAYTWDAAAGRYVDAVTAPLLDPTTVSAATAALYRVDVDPPELIPVEAASTHAEEQDPGVVNLVPAAGDTDRRLAPGRYVFAIRGGEHGLKTQDGDSISADTAIALTIPNKDLTIPANQPPGGIPDQNGSGSNADELQLLEFVRAALWAPTGWVDAGGNWVFCGVIPAPQPAGCATPVAPAYGAIDAFPRDEIASIAAFQIAPATGSTVPAVDPASGKAPLPIDLLRTGPDGHIGLNHAFDPAAEGLTTLDGFSTTAMLLAPVITPGSAQSFIDASTVHGDNVFLYKLGGATPTRLSELTHPTGTPAYLAEPPPIVVHGAPCPIAGGCSPVIGLQPAVGTGTNDAPVGFFLPPLDEQSDYAVVITNRVHDLAGQPVGRPTLMTLLLDPNPLVHPVTGASLVGGLDAATAKALQDMRTALQPVFANLPGGTTLDNVALAYTFRTQSITGTAFGLAATPYDPANAPLQLGTVTSATFLTPATVAGQYGIDVSHLPVAPAGPIAEFAEVKVNTLNLLLGSQNQGAFDPAHPVPESITALVAIPNPALVTAACPAGFTAAHCAPLVVFRHGIGRSKADMLPVAAALTARGFVVASIDAEKHGDRSYCTSDAQCCPAALCGTASTCSFKANLTTSVDGATPIGVCESAPDVRGGYLNKRVDCAQPFEPPDSANPNPACLSPKGIPYVSANYLVSLNFFRTRDSLRQDVLDQSAVVKAFAPFGQSADAFAQHLKDNGDIAIDPGKVYWVSQSLGSIQGAVDIAANPRITRAVFNVPGAPVVDIFADPGSELNARLLALLAPIQPGTPEYLQLLQVAKWILDPADPANFARYVRTPVANPLLPIFPAPPSRDVLSQHARCDSVIPNKENSYFASQLGLTVPAPGDATTGFVQWYLGSASGTDCPASLATHGFLLDGANLSLTGKAQVTAAGFLASPAAQPATVRP